MAACRVWIASAILALASASDAAAGCGDEREPRTASAAFAQLVESRRAGAAPAAEAALTALDGFPRAEMLAVLSDVAAELDDDAAASAGLAVLARCGAAADAGLAARLLRPGAEPDLEAAVLAIARRDARTLAVLDGVARGADTAVRIAFVRAVEALDSLEAAAWIARCAERHADVRPESLARLGRLAQSLPHPAPEEALSVVRGVLAGVGSDALRDAVVAAGRMEDGESVPYLVALLREDDAGLRADAAWALEQISGLRLRERAERWEDWYAVELQWWRERSDAAFAALESGERAACSRALLEIAGRRASRDRLALRVAPLLAAADPAVARLAAQTLRVLRSKVAIAALLRALERPESKVGIEVWLALRAITRKDIPLDVEAWRAACRG